MRLFQAWGIDVFLHWSWFALVFIFYSTGQFGAEPIWGIATYLALFVIVLMHEFGHALACRSVGGQASTIVLWPLGGIAFVRPPQRPGAVLWSIVAGPLVNVVLVPVTVVAYLALVGNTPMEQWTPGQNFIAMVMFINAALLAFNMLPIYPLDGGQTLQSILWFFMGRSQSLKIAAVVGLACTPILFGLALWTWRPVLLLISLFIGWQAYAGYRTAILLAQQEEAAERWRRPS